VTVLCTIAVRGRIDDTSPAQYGSTSSWEKTMNRSKTILAGLLTAAVGLSFGSAAQAQGWRDRTDATHQHESHRQVQAQPQWQGHSQWQGRSQGRSQWQGQRHYAPQYQSRAWGGYGGAYRGGAYRGGYVGYSHPHHYRAYDWRARHLSAPPYGYGWVEDDSGDVLLMALATGLIANAIVNSAAQPAPYYQAPAQPYYPAPGYSPPGYPSPDYPY
jgi:Ni/Co efflux regulator RcnB